MAALTRHYFLSVLIAVAPALAFAQVEEPVPVRVYTPYTAPTTTAVDTPVTVQAIQGTVNFQADTRIDGLMEEFTQHAQTIKGYRVQIHLGERKAAEDVKRAFLLKYPDVPAYLSWLPPNFRVRVGDLRTRVEAERLLRTLKADHTGSYIVPDDIELPALAKP